MSCLPQSYVAIATILVAIAGRIDDNATVVNALIGRLDLP
jgi:hypothetical protein